MIFNLSNRKYNYEKFDDRVWYLYKKKNLILSSLYYLYYKIREFAWEDHHSPPIDMLFDVCKQVDDFLKSEINNVAIIHC